MRDYLDNRRWQGEPRLSPRRCCHGAYRRRGFTHMFIPEGEPPREWAERLYNVRRWSVMARGGHFALLRSRSW